MHIYVYTFDICIVLVSSPVVVIKYPEKSNLKKEMVFFVCHSVVFCFSNYCSRRI